MGSLAHSYLLTMATNVRAIFASARHFEAKQWQPYASILLLVLSFNLAQAQSKLKRQIPAPAAKPHSVARSDASSVAARATVPAQVVSAGDVIISEFRFRGAAGLSDEFVELYNNTDADITVSATDGSNGWAVATSDGAERFAIPNGVVIPARGHVLAVDPVGYSLADYGGTGNATGNNSFLDIPDNDGIALFTTTNPANFTLANRLDAVGFGDVVNPLYREGAGLLPNSGITENGEYSFVRNLKSGFPQDTGDNANDFIFVSTTGGVFSGITTMLGAPGPENLSSPIARTAQFPATLIDPTAPTSAAPNRVRIQRASCPSCDDTSSKFGTLEFRRKFTNNTSQPVTRLRLRLVELTTLNSPGYSVGGTQADLRVLSATDIALDLDNNGSFETPVQGATLETPPPQPIGGGVNSSITVTLGAAIPVGGSVNIRTLTGVQQTGNFRIFVNVEVLP